jgi:predicted Fe-Mo cluster-binding NifX family protein
MEKIAVSSEGPGLDARVDPRFGRAAGFAIVDLQTMACDYIDNGASQVMARGAGIQAAEIVAATGARVLLTGFVGPKAFQALRAAGIEIGQNIDQYTVRQAVQQFQNGQVSLAVAPNRRGHGR